MRRTHSLIRLAGRVAAAALTMAVVLVLVHPTGGSAQTTGTIPLNPDHVGATAEEFFDEGECAGTEVAPGEALWHFVVPNNADFTSLTVTFQDAGTITLGPGDFGPPDDSHAFVTTGADDVLLSGTANFSTDGPSSPSFFNLSHTCIGEEVTTTTSSTTTTTGSTTTTTGSTTTTTASTTTTAPTTTTMRPGVTTTQPAVTTTTVSGGRVPAVTGPDESGWWPPSLRTSLFLLASGLLAFLLTGDRSLAVVRRAWARRAMPFKRG